MSRPERASPLVAALVSNRALIAISFGTLLVVATILALVTGSWWAVVLAAGAHAVGTLAVAGVIVQLTTETEHASPGVAARLEEEGVPDPDRLVSERLDDSAGCAAPEDIPAADRKRFGAIAVVVVGGVMVFVAVMGLIGGYM